MKNIYNKKRYCLHIEIMLYQFKVLKIPLCIWWKVCVKFQTYANYMYMVILVHRVFYIPFVASFN
jgi:hypothetical protein